MIRENTATVAEPTLRRGDSIGRYVVLALVGRGGMGEVYAAYDPELERKVAVKLLRARAGDSADTNTNAGRARLLREAQAIAKLSHPNVVVVYDVGTFGKSVFVAMELVHGHTVAFWVQSQKRSVREVLNVFLAAGRGLAAAHEAGLVHRDFKPENVMVTSEGQVRVMDFGLARQVVMGPSGIAEAAPDIDDAAAAAVAADAQPPFSSDDSLAALVGLDATRIIGRAAPVSTSAALASKLTQTGALLGTPAYMAPEQFAGRPSDARTDQFSFCVALYEALYGERPFRGETMGALRATVAAGTVADAPPHARVPAWLRRVLLRGLRPNPADRFPSMGDLLAALEHDPARFRRRWIAAAAAVALVAALVGGAHQLATGQRALCAGGPDHLTGVWELGGAPSRRKQQIHDAFLATRRSYAAQAFTGVTTLLDHYVASWAAMYADACEATHERGEQSSEVLDLRMSCLNERLADLHALTEVFTRADAAAVENAVSAAGALRQPDGCANVPLLRAVVKPPDDAATHARVAAAKQQIARLRALASAGQCAAAGAEAPGIITAARSTGYTPVLGEALYVAGVLGESCVNADQATGYLKESFRAASAAHDDEQAARAAIAVAGIAANRGGRPDLAWEWVQVAEAALARIGNPPLLEAWLAVSRGNVEGAQGKYDAAIATQQRALALKERVLGKDHADVARSLLNVGFALQAAGRYAEARAANQRALAVAERTLGRDHPLVALIVGNQGEVLNALGHPQEARRAFERALATWRQAGADTYFSSYPLVGIGLTYLAEARAEEAVLPLAEAYAIRTHKSGDAAERGEAAFALARALWHHPQDHARARALAQEARAFYAKAGDAAKLAKKTAEIESWLATAD